MTENDFAVWMYFHATFGTPLSRMKRWPPIELDEMDHAYYILRPTRCEYGMSWRVSTWAGAIRNVQRRRPIGLFSKKGRKA